MSNSTGRLVRVAVVRQERDPGDWAIFLVVGIALTALVGWLVMLIAGTVTDWGLSYWHSVLAVVGVRLVQVSSGWGTWTHPFNKKQDRGGVR